MMVNGKNECIRCTINYCAYNNEQACRCTLDSIQIGTHEQNPTKKECVDCESFKNKME